nr:immunoglobulin light chain junction region [Macaca mulatta]MOW04147.1 immunoglobulin light chain junction region [Macaca mulatta]MOW04339.1 immunoglobulin light chain junction region [Macaca mulatta]MOW04530.1 immunoglobulin light chain junction region [Macaca mulatta]MOW04553.1 immunoglobulin light chain junction region [Macaca mulatta]
DYYCATWHSSASGLF